MSERIYYWDNFKGVLIFLVVFAHLLFLPSLHAFRDAIYMFHIPAFVFISGYFGKSTHSHCSESILKLLSAYIIFNSLFSIIYNAYSFLYTSSVYWYVFALIVWRLSAPCLAKYKSCLLILTALSILIGYYHEINGVFNLARIISFSPFYMAGYLLSCETAQERMIQKSPRVILTGVGSIVLAFLIGFFSYNVIGFSGEELCMYPYRSWEFGGIGRVCLMLTSAFSIYALGCIIPNKKVPLLSRFGKYSLSIYLFHGFLPLFYKYVYISHEYSFLFFAFGVSMATCIIFSLPFVVQLTDKVFSAGAKVLLGNYETNYYTIVVRTLFWGIAVIFLFHEPILRIVYFFYNL